MDKNIDKVGHELALAEKRAKAIKKAVSKESVDFVLPADWESPKALGYDLKIRFQEDGRVECQRVFIPKSISSDGRGVPLWLVVKKIETSLGRMPHCSGAYVASIGGLRIEGVSVVRTQLTALPRVFGALRRKLELAGVDRVPIGAEVGDVPFSCH